MTKEITKANILQELGDKFQLREFEPEKFLFSELVVPVYDIASHLTRHEVKHNTMSVTSVTGFLFFTVPENERWILRAYQVIFGMTGAHQGSGLYISCRPGVSDNIYLDLKKGQDVSYLITLVSPVVLQPKSRLAYLIDSYTSTQDLTIDIDVTIEGIR